MWRVHPLLGTHYCAFQHGLVAKTLQRVQLTHSAQRLASFRPAASAASAGRPCYIERREQQAAQRMMLPSQALQNLLTGMKAALFTPALSCMTVPLDSGTTTKRSAADDQACCLVWLQLLTWHTCSAGRLSQEDMAEAQAAKALVLHRARVSHAWRVPLGTADRATGWHFVIGCLLTWLPAPALRELTREQQMLAGGGSQCAANLLPPS